MSLRQRDPGAGGVEKKEERAALIGKAAGGKIYEPNGKFNDRRGNPVKCASGRNRGGGRI
jgi:hypothetical protein